MSWEIKFLGTDENNLEDEFDAVDGSGFTSYTSGWLLANGTAITGATAASPPVFTLTGHGFQTDQIVTITHDSGISCTNDWASAFSSSCDNGEALVERVSADTFKIKIIKSTAVTQSIELRGVQPDLIDESEEYKYFGGGYRKVISARIKWLLTFFRLITRPLHGKYKDIPEATAEEGRRGQLTYMNLLYLLSLEKKFIIGWDAEYERLTNYRDAELNSCAGETPYNYVPAIQVELYSKSELSANFDLGVDIPTIELVSVNRYNFSGVMELP